MRMCVMCLSVNGRKPRPILELPPLFGVPAPFGALQVAVIPFSSQLPLLSLCTYADAPHVYDHIKRETFPTLNECRSGTDDASVEQHWTVVR